MGLVFAGKLVYFMNMLYMELIYTGTLDWSTIQHQSMSFKLVLPVTLRMVLLRVLAHSNARALLN